MDKKKITNMEVKKKTGMMFFAIFVDRERYQTPIFHIT